MKKYLDTNKNIYCKPSEIHGVGIFAKEDLELGTIGGRSSPNNVLDITRNVYDRIRIASEHSETGSLFLASVNTYSYYCPKKDALIYSLDNVRYTNHSDSPNSIDATDNDYHHMSKLNYFVSKDTEITENYRSYDSCPGADECTHNLFSIGSPFLTPKKDIEKGSMYIALTKDQIEVYSSSYLCTDIQKSLLTCVNQFGSFDDDVGKISIPYYKQIENINLDNKISQGGEATCEGAEDCITNIQTKLTTPVYYGKAGHERKNRSKEIENRVKDEQQYEEQIEVNPQQKK